jgi:hypothetical protein
MLAERTDLFRRSAGSSALPTGPAVAGRTSVADTANLELCGRGPGRADSPELHAQPTIEGIGINQQW